MEDSVLAGDWDENLTIEISQDVLRPVLQLLFVDEIVNFADVFPVLAWLDEAVCDHQVGSLELTYLERKADWGLFVVEIQSVYDTQLVVLEVPSSSTD